MSIPPGSPTRGVAASFSQPVSCEDRLHAEETERRIRYYNTECCVVQPPPLRAIEYRSSEGEYDLVNHVFRWDSAPYDHVFTNGFRARPVNGTSESVYYSLDRYVNCGGRPLDSRRESTYVYVSTTLSSRWRPTPPNNLVYEVYRYEIYAPGGIQVRQTLGGRYRYSAQEEVAFPVGIAPQYIRSAQLFRLQSGRPMTSVDNILYYNTNFNPNNQRSVLIQNPVLDYYDANGVRRPVSFKDYPPRREKRDVEESKANYYKEGVAKEDNYIDSAFRLNRENEAFVFVRKECLLLNYAPATKDDKVLEDKFICNRLPFLADTAFAEYGIDAAFNVTGVEKGVFSDSVVPTDKAIIFSGNLCAKISYSAYNTKGSIIEGPKMIKDMFPFFKVTKFENRIDAAFESTTADEAYLFKGDEYALIDFKIPKLIAVRKITQGFFCLENTKFASNIGAAFASHKPNEAYMFKGNSYILLHFTPASNKDRIIGGPKEIVPTNWPSLKDYLPRKNRGLDVYDSEQYLYQRDQDVF